jgi:hypothetical protein
MHSVAYCNHLEAWSRPVVDMTTIAGVLGEDVAHYPKGVPGLAGEAAFRSDLMDSIVDIPDALGRDSSAPLVRRKCIAKGYWQFERS